MELVKRVMNVRKVRVVLVGILCEKVGRTHAAVSAVKIFPTGRIVKTVKTVK